jgi:hypothetical protein
MPTKTYYAKLDCYSAVANVDTLFNEQYKTFMDFMSYLTASNVAELVSWNSGSGAASGSFDERTYWDGAKPFGAGAHSLWKFNTSSTRNWEWYMYTQVVSGAAGSIRQTFNTPISGYGNSSDFIAINNTVRGILVQTAVCFSGTTSFNPWNGSISDGSGNASIGAGNGSIRWISGSNDRTLYVLPRSNDTGGSQNLQRSNGIALSNMSANESSYRIHFAYDGDALLIANDISANQTYSISYFGSFPLRNTLTASGIGGTDYGIVMYSNINSNLNFDGVPNLFNPNVQFGDTTGTTTNENGGIAVPIGDAISGSKTAIPQGIDNFLGTTYQPNTLINAYDEIPIYVGISELPFRSYLGTLNTGLVRYMVNVGSNDMKDDYTRAIVGGSTTLSNLKLSIPWSGSIAIGIGTDRTGSNFTWTTNYG